MSFLSEITKTSLDQDFHFFRMEKEFHNFWTKFVNSEDSAPKVRSKPHSIFDDYIIRIVNNKYNLYLRKNNVIGT